MTNIVTFLTAIFTAGLIFASLTRALISPEVTGKLVAINIITTKVIILISLLSLLLDSWLYIDVALVFALCSYAGSVAVLKGQLHQRLDQGGE
jgi:multicomponent Na+:H+ antiporter subunit F